MKGTVKCSQQPWLMGHYTRLLFVLLLLSSIKQIQKRVVQVFTLCRLPTRVRAYVLLQVARLLETPGAVHTFERSVNAARLSQVLNHGVSRGLLDQS